MMKKQTIISMALTLILLSGFSNVALASTSQQDIQLVNDTESLSEDIIDFVIANDDQKVIETLSEIKKNIASIIGNYKEITSEEKNKLESDVKIMEELWNSGSKNKFIVADNQFFLDLIDLMYKIDNPIVPKAVIELDYLGRELQFQPMVGDWKKTQGAVDSVKLKWEGLKSQIEEKGLSDLLDSTIKGLYEAVLNKDSDLLFYQGQLILDEVDLLEGYFKKNTAQNLESIDEKSEDINESDNEDADKGWFKDNDNKQNEEDASEAEEEDEEWPLAVGIGFGGLLAGLAIGRYKDIFSLLRKK